MSEYNAVKGGKLNLKGAASVGQKKKKKKVKRKREEGLGQPDLRHGEDGSRSDLRNHGNSLHVTPCKKPQQTTVKTTCNTEHYLSYYQQQ